MLENRTVFAEGGPLAYALERKRVKNLNLRVRRDGSVYVSAGSRVPVRAIDEFVAQKSDFIRKAQARLGAQAPQVSAPRQFVSGEKFYVLGRPLELKVSKGPKDAAFVEGPYLCLTLRAPEDPAKRQGLMEKFRDEQCREVFGALLAELYPKVQPYGAVAPTLRIRDMETRWGSCLAGKGAITLNKRLLCAPRGCIAYVVMHELCHLIHPNHSRAFYDLLTALMPDWKARKEELNKGVAVWGFEKI